MKKKIEIELDENDIKALECARDVANQIRQWTIAGVAQAESPVDVIAALGYSVGILNKLLELAGAS